MKILKYVLLLLLLFSIATIIFVATLKPDYRIVKIKTVNFPKENVFNYINDYKNWEKFGFSSTKNLKFKHLNKSNFSWKSQDNEGKIQTISSKNDSIFQKMNFNGANSKVYWILKESNGKTKIIWTNIGKMDFFDKIFSNLSGGMDNTVGIFFEKSLININENLSIPKPQKIDTVLVVKPNLISNSTKALQTAPSVVIPTPKTPESRIETNQPEVIKNIVVNGFQEKQIKPFIQYTINSANSNLESNIQIMIPILMKYLKDNKISFSGKPFVKYNMEYKTLKVTNISVCQELEADVKSKLPNKMTLSVLKPFQCIKTTLIGDLSLKSEAKLKTYELMNANNLIQKTDFPVIEYYTINKTDTKNSANWVTEIYMPVKKKSVVKKVFKPIFSSSNVINESVKDQTKPTETPVVVPEINIKKDIPQ